MTPQQDPKDKYNQAREMFLQSSTFRSAEGEKREEMLSKFYDTYTKEFLEASGVTEGFDTYKSEFMDKYSKKKVETSSEGPGSTSSVGSKPKSEETDGVPYRHEDDMGKPVESFAPKHPEEPQLPETTRRNLTAFQMNGLKNRESKQYFTELQQLNDNWKVSTATGAPVGVSFATGGTAFLDAQKGQREAFKAQEVMAQKTLDKFVDARKQAGFVQPDEYETIMSMNKKNRFAEGGAESLADIGWLEQNMKKQVDTRKSMIELEGLRKKTQEGVETFDPTATEAAAKKITEMIGGGYYTHELAYETLKNETLSNIYREQIQEEAGDDLAALDNRINADFAESFRKQSSVLAEADAKISTVYQQMSDSAKSQAAREYESYKKNTEAQAKEIKRLVDTGEVDPNKAQDELDAANALSYQNFLEASEKISTKLQAGYEAQVRQMRKRIDKQLVNEMEAYSKEYNIPDDIKKEYEKVLKDAGENVRAKQELVLKVIDRHDDIGNLALRGYINSLGRSIAATSKALKWQDGVVLGDRMHEYTKTSSGELGEFSDLLDYTKVMNASSNLAGSMTTSIAAGMAVGAATSGAGTIPAMASVMLASWGTETMDMAGQMYRDVLDRTGSQSKAQHSADKMVEAQVMNMWAYSLDGLPFVGKALRGMSFVPRVLTGATAEVGMEWLQEAPQGLQQQQILETGSWQGYTDGWDWDYSKKTFLQISPVALLGGGGQVAQHLGDVQKKEAIARAIAYETLAKGLDVQSAFQYLFNGLANGTESTVNSALSSLYADQKITSDEYHSLMSNFEVVKGVASEAKKLGLTQEQARVYLFLKEAVWASQLDAEGGGATSVQKSIAANAEKNLEDFVQDPSVNGEYAVIGTGTSKQVVSKRGLIDFMDKMGIDKVSELSKKNGVSEVFLNNIDPAEIDARNKKEQKAETKEKPEKVVAPKETRTQKEKPSPKDTEAKEATKKEKTETPKEHGEEVVPTEKEAAQKEGTPSEGEETATKTAETTSEETVSDAKEEGEKATKAKADTAPKADKTEPSTPEASEVQSDEQVNKKVVNAKVDEISTDTETYQGRKKAYSEKTVNKVEKNYDPNKFDPIVLFKQDDGKTVVLSGHSRFEAFKRMGKKEIPARYFEPKSDTKEGRQKEAKEFARQSNRLADPESIVESAAYYRERREAGKNRGEVMKEAQENEPTGTARQTVNMSYLNPKGKTIDALVALEKSEGDTRTNLRAVASKIGEIRMANPHLTDAHENELFDFFTADKKNIPTDADIRNQDNPLMKSVAAAQFDPDAPLNLKRTKTKSIARAEWEAERDKLQSRRKELRTETIPNKKTGITGVKKRALASLMGNKENTKENLEQAEKDFRNNKDGVKDQHDKILAEKKAELQRVESDLQKHLLLEQQIAQGDKAQGSLFEQSDVPPAQQAIRTRKQGIVNFVNESLKILLRSLPTEVIFDQKRFDAAAEKGGARGSSRGSMWKGKVYLNPKKVTKDSAIHEFGHLYLAHMKKYNPPLHNKGLNLAKESEVYSQKKEDPVYEGLSERDLLDETLAELIGLAGMKKLDAAFKSSKEMSAFKTWLAKIKEWLGDNFFLDKRKDIKDMTLEQFLDGALTDMLGGRPIETNIFNRKPRLQSETDTSRLRIVPIDGGGKSVQVEFETPQGESVGKAKLSVQDRQTGLSTEVAYTASVTEAAQETEVAKRILLDAAEQGAQTLTVDGLSEGAIKEAASTMSKHAPSTSVDSDGNVVVQMNDDFAIDTANDGKPLFQSGFSEVGEISALFEQLSDQGFSMEEIEEALVAEGYDGVLVNSVLTVQDLLGNNTDDAFIGVSAQKVEQTSEQQKFYGQKIARALAESFPGMEVTFTKRAWEAAGNENDKFSPVRVSGNKVAFHPDYISPSTTFAMFARAWVNGALQTSPDLMSRIREIMGGTEYLKQERSRESGNVDGAVATKDQEFSNTDGAYFNAFIEAITDKALTIGDQPVTFQQKVKRLLSDIFEKFVRPLRRLGIWKQGRTSAKSLLSMTLEDFTTTVAEELTMTKAMSPHVRAAFGGATTDINAYRAAVQNTLNTKIGNTRHALFMAMQSGVSRADLMNMAVTQLKLSKELATALLDRIEAEISFLNNITSIPLADSYFHRFMYDARKFFTEDKIYLKKIQQSIEKSKGILPDDLNSEAKFQLQRSRAAHQIEGLKEYIYGIDEGKLFQLSGRTSTFQKRKAHNRSLQTRIKRKTGLSLGDFSRYLYSLHAPERNARLKERSIEKAQTEKDRLEAILASDTTDRVKEIASKRLELLENNQLEGFEIVENGSRMSDKQAQKIQDSFTEQQKRDLNEFAKEFRNNVIRRRLDIELANGYIDQDRYDAMMEGTSEDTGVLWENYVPLVIDPLLFSEGKFKGDANARHSAQIHAAEGRGPYTDKMVVDVVRQSVLQLAESITRTEQNNAMVALVKLAQQNPDPSVWKVHRPTTHRTNNELEMVGDMEDPSVVSAKLSESVKARSVPVRMPNGKVVYFEPVHEGIKNMVRKDLPNQAIKILTAGASVITNFNRAVITSLNIAFGLPNVTRDIQDALGNISLEKSKYDLKGIRGTILKNIPKAAVALTMTEFGAVDGISSGPMKKIIEYLHESQEAGAWMSWTSYDGIKDQMKRLQEVADNGGMEATEKYTKMFVHALFDVALTMNDVFEMSTRLGTYIALREKGLSVQKSAYAAKNITVNFELKGDSPIGDLISSAFLFLRVGAKGAIRSAASTATRSGLKFYAGITMLSYLNKALIMALMPEDDKEKFRALPDYQWGNNTFFFNPFNPSVPIKIPKPYSFLRFFMALGEGLYDLTAKEKSTYSVASNLTQNVNVIMNPVSGNQPNSVAAMLPVLASNAAEIEMNKKWNNSPIYPRNTLGMADMEKYFKDTNPMFINMANKMYNNMGVDVSPETIKYMFDEVAGGVVSEVTWAATMTDSTSINETPIVRRFLQDLRGDDRMWASNIYKYVDEMATHDITDKEKKTVWLSYKKTVTDPDEPTVSKYYAKIINDQMWDKYEIDITQGTWKRAKEGKARKRQEKMDAVREKLKTSIETDDKASRMRKKIKAQNDKILEEMKSE